jgi:hypothetical protein
MKCSYNRIIKGKLSGYEQATFEFEYKNIIIFGSVSLTSDCAENCSALENYKVDSIGRYYL